MKISILLLMTTLSLSSFAQKDSSREFVPPILYRSLGVSFQKFDGLNSRIATRPEFKTLRDYTATLEVGSVRVFKRFVSDFILTAGSSMSGDREKKSSTLRYLGVGIDFGYDLIKNENIMLYPLVGIGGQNYQARFYKDNSLVNFNDVLQSSATQNNIRPVDFKNAFFNYRLGLGFAVRSAKHPYSSIGLRVGYNGSFKDKAWKSSDNQTLAGAPVDKLSQFNVALVFTSMPRFMKH